MVKRTEQFEGGYQPEKTTGKRLDPPGYVKETPVVDSVDEGVQIDFMLRVEQEEGTSREDLMIVSNKQARSLYLQLHKMFQGSVI